MEINLKSNIDEFIKLIDQKYTKKIPTIIKSSLNKTIFAVEKDLRMIMPQVFDKPTKYLVDNAFEVSEKATETNPAVAIGLNRLLGQRILAPHILGIEREDRPTETKMKSSNIIGGVMQTVSAKGTRNVSGNVNLNKFKQLEGKLFSSFPVTPRTKHLAQPGIYKRKNKSKNIEPFVLFTKGKIKYKKRFDFKKIVSELASKHFESKFVEAFKAEINK